MTSIKICDLIAEEAKLSIEMWNTITEGSNSTCNYEIQ